MESNIFKYDGLYSRTISLVVDLFLMNILFVILCLPIVTIGPNITALFRVMFNLIDKKGSSIVVTYFKTFKNSFKQSLGLFLISVISLIIVIGDLYYFNVFLDINSILINGLFIFVLFLVMNISIYSYTQISFFDNKLLYVLKNSLLLSISNLKNTLLISLVYIIPFVLFFIENELLPFILLFCITIGISSSFYFITFLLNKTFKELSHQRNVTEKL